MNDPGPEAPDEVEAMLAAVEAEAARTVPAEYAPHLAAQARHLFGV